jgi:hypothetical protein
MSQPFFVDHNGVPLEWQRSQPTVTEVEAPEEPLHIIAAREAERQSTHKFPKD